MERTVRKERELGTSDVSTPYASVPAPPFEAHFSVYSVVIFLRTMNNPGWLSWLSSVARPVRASWPFACALPACVCGIGSPTV
jgi:hypothetical protein